MAKRIKNLAVKYKEFLLYALFGVFTTVANFAAFWICTHLLGERFYLFNNAVAWLAGVIVAFVTNKLWVFNSKTWEFRVVSKEITEFTAARLLSFVFEETGMWFFVDVLSFGDKSLQLLGFTISGQIIVKLLLSIVVVILNYFFSKFIIFKNKTKNKG